MKDRCELRASKGTLSMMNNPPRGACTEQAEGGEYDRCRRKRIVTHSQCFIVDSGHPWGMNPYVLELYQGTG